MLRARPQLKKHDDIEIYMIDFKPGINLCHIYMEAQIFTPDSKYFIVHSGATPHGSQNLNPADHRYYLCNLQNDCELTPLTTEPEATAPTVAPDGKGMYYILDRSITKRQKNYGIELKYVNLDGSGRETIAVIDGRVAGTRLYPGAVYPLSTISSDGRHLAIKMALNPEEKSASYTNGMLVFDLKTGESWLPLIGEEWVNVHPQYSRSPDEQYRYDIMVQHNHGRKADKNRKLIRHHSGLGMDIHLIKDDGTNMRDFPWSRTPDELCHGHQCWIGRSNWALEQCSTRKPHYVDGMPVPADSPGGALTMPLIAGQAGVHGDHHGKLTEDGLRVDLTENIKKPFFAHFATDIAGKRLISDSRLPEEEDWRYLYTASLPALGAEPAENWTLIADTASAYAMVGAAPLGIAHAHPFLSPDGKYGFFNSIESGILRPYIIKNIDALFKN